MSALCLNQIKILESQAAVLDPDKATRAQWNSITQTYAETFLGGLTTRQVYHPGTANEGFSPISDCAIPIEQLLSQLNQQIDHQGIDTSSGRYLGFIPGGGLYPSALGDYIAALTNRYSGVFFASPGAVRLENQLIRWMADLIGFPHTASGSLTSGGSTANLIAMVTAREAFSLQPKNVESAVVYITRNTHTSAQKALKVAGLGSVIKRYVPVDQNYSMRLDELEKLIAADLQAGLQPWLLNASAGTTDTGSVDSLDEMASIAKKYNLWFHIDAAYGGFFLLTEKGKTLFQGIEKADSVTLDPHKSLFLPYGSGAVIVRQYHLQKTAFTESAPCLQDCINLTDELSPADLSPELTRHFRALRMWLPLQLFGVQAFRAALEEKLLLANYFFQKLTEIPGLQVACYPQLSIVTFRYLPKDSDVNAFNTKWLQAINADGRIYLSSTTLNGDFYLRMACLSFRTHLKEIELALGVLRQTLIFRS